MFIFSHLYVLSNARRIHLSLTSRFVYLLIRRMQKIDFMVIEGIRRERTDIIKGFHYLAIDSISSSTSIFHTNISNCLNQTKEG
jgi:hypothetical protein